MGIRRTSKRKLKYAEERAYLRQVKPARTRTDPGCTNKFRHPSFEDAHPALAIIQAFEPHKAFHIYKCDYCLFWHVGSGADRRQALALEQQRKAQAQANDVSANDLSPDFPTEMPVS